MPSSCADRSFSQQLQPPKSSKIRKGCLGTFSPFSATPPQERKAQLSTANLSPREPVFESFDSLCHHWCNFCKRERKKKTTTESNKKSPHMKAKVRAESNSKLQPWQTRVFERGPSEFSGHRLRRRLCFLHCTNTDPCLNPPCSFPRELHSNSKQLDRHRAAKAEVLPHCYH